MLDAELAELALCAKRGRVLHAKLERRVKFGTRIRRIRPEELYSEGARSDGHRDEEAPRRR